MGLLINPYAFVAAGTASGVLTYRTSSQDTSNGQTYTFTNVNIGSANANRWVVVGIAWSAVTNPTIPSTVTINGVTAALVTKTNSSDGAALYWANVPTGTSVSIVVTFSNSSPTDCGISVWTSDLAGLIYFDSATAGAAAASVTLTDIGVIVGGALAAICGNVLTSDTMSASYNGADSLITDFSNKDSDGQSVISGHVLTTEEVATNDVTFTANSLTHTKFAVGASFVGLSGSAYAPVLADHTSSTVDASSYTFTARSIGTANASRMVLVCFAWEAATTRTVSSVTVAGNAATRVDAREGTTGGAAIYRIAVAAGTSADIVVNMSGTCTRLGIGIYDTRPRVTNTPIDFGNNGVTATSVSIADIDVRNGGFLIMAGRTASSSEANSSTYNGVDTLTKDAEDSVESAARFTYWSCLTTENVATNDPGYSSASSLARSAAAASWL